MRTGEEPPAQPPAALSAQEREQLAAMKRGFRNAHSVNSEFDCGGAIPKCREEVEALWLVADGGCDVKLRERLEAHFEHCSYCHSQYEVEVRIKELLSKKCKAGPCAPDTLKEKLRMEIHTMLSVSHPRGDSAIDPE